MSENDKDALLGKLIRKQKTLQNDLSFLYAAISEIRDDLSSTIKVLTEYARADHLDRREPLPESIKRSLNAEALDAKLQEIIDKESELKDVSARLEKLGV